jgi:hypothetical protein
MAAKLRLLLLSLLMMTVSLSLVPTTEGQPGRPGISPGRLICIAIQGLSFEFKDYESARRNLDVSYQIGRVFTPRLGEQRILETAGTAVIYIMNVVQREITIPVAAVRRALDRTAAECWWGWDDSEQPAWQVCKDATGQVLCNIGVTCNVF